MKRSLLFFMLATLFAGGGKLSASELNIYASGLRLHGATAAEQVTGENQVHIDYFLNAPATDLQFLVLDASTGEQLTSVTIPAGTSKANYAKGSHSNVVVDLSSYYGNGATYKWAIKATAGATTLTSVISKTTLYNFYSPQGLAVDNSFESDYFGRIYVAESMSAKTAAGREKGQGIFILGPGLDDITGQGNSSYNGGVSWNSSSTSISSAGLTWDATGPARLTVADDGYVFICDNGRQSDDVNTSGVWMMDPSNPSANFKAVLDVSKNNSIYHRANSCAVLGSGANKVLYLVDWSDSIISYPVGNCTTPYTTKGTTWRNNLAGINIVNAFNTLVRGKNGAFWLFQYRGSLDTYPIVTHFNADAERDFYISSESNSGLAPATNPCRRGCGAVSPDGSKLAFYGNGTMYIYDVNYNANGVPALSNGQTIGSVGGTNADAIAFDVANNLYFASASKEYFFAYSTPKSTNTCTTPAASSRTIVLGSYIPPTLVTGVSLDQDSKTLVKGQSFTLTATVAPNDATNKKITWTSTDPTVASVSNGVVTANAVGEATITVTTEDGSFTATCDVTVELMHGTYNIGGASADFPTLHEAAACIRTAGMSGDVTFLVCADIAETGNIGLTNTTDHTITIRPDAAVKRTISFGEIDDNAGPSGHVIIGYDMLDWAATTSKNIIIDGSYNNAGQYLEFQGGTVGGVVVVYYGKVTDSEVRNCRLISPRTSGTTYVAQFRSEKSTDNAPTGVGFKNCYMQVTGVTNAQAVYYNGSQSSTAAGKPKDCYVKDCEIVSNLRGVFFNGAINATFEGNTFRFTSASGGYIAHAIMGNAQSGTITVRNNKFIQLATNNTSAGAYGIHAITASGGANVWIIENNYFAGIDALAAGVTTKDFTLEYIYSNDSCVVRHNTFYMPSLTNKPNTAISSANPITCVQLYSSKKHHVINNLFYSAETSAANSLIYGAMNENVKNNVYYHAGTNAKIHATSSSSEADWEAFEAAGYAEGSVWKQATFTDAANGDLSITTIHSDFRMDRLPEVLKDITGRDRDERTYAGAYEVVPIHINSLAIDQSDAILKVGGTLNLTATVDPANATEGPVVWSSDDDCATVNASGVVTGVSDGTAHITASADGKSSTITVEVYTPTPHIFAYDLRSVLDGSTYKLSFKSNTPYTAANIILYDKDGNQYGDKIAVSSLPVSISRSDLPEGLSLNWAVELTAAVNKEVNELTDASRGIYNFYLPQGLAVDNSTESDYFGNIYITEPVDGESDGGTARSKAQKAGLFVYDPQLNEMNTTNEGYTLGLSLPAANRYGFKRVNVDVDGNVYVNSTSAIYKASPADFTTSTAIGSNLFTNINSFGISYIGDNMQICIMDNANTTSGGGTLKLMTAPFDATTELLNSSKFATQDNAVVPDGRGGWWVAQHRYSVDGYNPLSHVSASGTIDYCINNSSNTSLIPNLPASYRGVVATNREGTMLALGSGNTVVLYDITWLGNVPSLALSEATLPTLGQNIDGIAFDYADNLYVVSAKTERFFAFTLPATTNTCIVPAKRSLILAKHDPIVLDETSEDNSTTIAAAATAGVKRNVTLKRHFSVADGMYTIVLPFDLDDAQLQEAFGAGYKLSVMQQAYYKSADVLYLKFGFVDHLEAGVPCLLQVGADVTEDILFRDVTIDNAEPIIAFEDVVEMRGLYDMTEVPAAVTNYYLGSGDYLFQYKTDIQTKAFRSFFHFPGFATSAPPRAARVVFHEEVATDEPMLEGTPATIQPEKIIRDGEMLIIVDGIEYDMMGRPRVR